MDARIRTKTTTTRINNNGNNNRIFPGKRDIPRSDRLSDLSSEADELSSGAGARTSSLAYQARRKNNNNNINNNLVNIPNSIRPRGSSSTLNNGGNRSRLNASYDYSNTTTNNNAPFRLPEIR